MVITNFAQAFKLKAKLSVRILLSYEKCKFPYILLVLCLANSMNVIGQVTIGSDYPPETGALLDLKEKPDGTSTRGLLLPRVNLTANNVLTIATGAAANTDHIGSMVYNTNTIEIDETTRLCPGIHVWYENQWVPLQPYPKVIIPPSLAGPQPDLIDPRDNETIIQPVFIP